MRTRMTRDFYIPKESAYRVNVERQVYEEEGAEIYTFLTSDGKPVAMMFGGKRSEPDKHYSYASVERRAQAIEEYLAALRRDKEYKAKVKAERKAAGRGVKVGDYLYASWGYEQTNINFYKIVGLVGKTMVEIVPVCSKVVGDYGSSLKVVPSDDEKTDYDSFIPPRDKDGNPARKVCKNGHVSLSSYASASKWDGTPRHETAPGYGH